MLVTCMSVLQAKRWLHTVTNSLSASNEEQNAAEFLTPTSVEMINFVATSQHQDEVPHIIEKLIAFLVMINESGKKAKNFLVSSLLEKVIDFGTDSSIVTDYRVEIIRGMNIILENSSSSTRLKLLCGEDFRQKLNTLFMTIGKAGDYEFQVCIFECLIRMIPKSKRSEIVNKTNVDDFLAQHFLSIRESHFETDCRRILNTLNAQNSSTSRVVTVSAENVKIDGEKVLKPVDDEYDQLWIDFNACRISFFTEPSESQSQEEGSTWETVSLWDDDVQHCVCDEQNSTWKINIELKPGAFIYSSKDPDDQPHLVVLDISTQYPLRAAISNTFRNTQIIFRQKCKASSVITPVPVISVSPFSKRQTDIEANQYEGQDTLSELSQQSKRCGAKVSVPLTPMSSPAGSAVSSCGQKLSWQYVNSNFKNTLTSNKSNNVQNKSRNMEEETAACSEPANAPGDKSDLIASVTNKSSLPSASIAKTALQITADVHVSSSSPPNEKIESAIQDLVEDSQPRKPQVKNSKGRKSDHARKKSGLLQETDAVCISREESSLNLISIEPAICFSSEEKDDKNSYVRRSQRHTSKESQSPFSKDQSSQDKTNKQPLDNKMNKLGKSSSPIRKASNMKVRDYEVLDPECNAGKIDLNNYSTDTTKSGLKTPPAKSLRFGKKVKTPVVTFEPKLGKTDIVSPAGDNSLKIQDNVRKPTQAKETKSRSKKKNAEDEGCKVQEPTISSVYEEKKRRSVTDKSSKTPQSQRDRAETNTKETILKKLISPGFASLEDFKVPKKVPSKRRSNDSKVEASHCGEVGGRVKKSSSKHKKNDILGAQKENGDKQIEADNLQIKHTESCQGGNETDLVPESNGPLCCKNVQENIANETHISKMKNAVETKNFETENFDEIADDDSNRKANKCPKAKNDKANLQSAASEEMKESKKKNKTYKPPCQLKDINSSHKEDKVETYVDPTVPHKTLPRSEVGFKTSALSHSIQNVNSNCSSKHVAGRTKQLSPSYAELNAERPDEGANNPTTKKRTDFSDNVSSSSSGFLFIEVDNAPEYDKTDFVLETQDKAGSPKSQQSNSYMAIHGKAASPNCPQSSNSSATQEKKVWATSPQFDFSVTAQDEVNNSAPIESTQNLKKAIDHKIKKLDKLIKPKLPANFGFEEDELNASGDYNLPNTEPQTSSNMESSYVFNKFGLPKHTTEDANSSNISSADFADGATPSQPLSIAKTHGKRNLSKSEPKNRQKIPEQKKGDKEDKKLKNVTIKSPSVTIKSPSHGCGDGLRIIIDDSYTSEKSDISRRKLRDRNKICYKEYDSHGTSLDESVTPHKAAPELVNGKDSRPSPETDRTKFSKHNNSFSTSSKAPKIFSSASQRQKKTIWQSKEFKTTVTTSFSQLVKSSYSSDPYSFDAECSSTSTQHAPMLPYRSFNSSLEQSPTKKRHSPEKLEVIKAKEVVKTLDLCHKNYTQGQVETMKEQKGAVYKKQDTQQSDKRRKERTKKEKKRQNKATSHGESVEFTLFSSQRSSKKLKDEKTSFEYALFSSQRSQVETSKSESGLYFPPLEDSIPCTPYEEVNDGDIDEDQPELPDRKSAVSEHSWTRAKTPANVQQKMRGKTYKTKGKWFHEHSDEEEDRIEEEEMEIGPLFQKLYENNGYGRLKKRTSAQTPQRKRVLGILEMEVTPKKSHWSSNTDKDAKGNASCTMDKKCQSQAHSPKIVESMSSNDPLESDRDSTAECSSEKSANSEHTGLKIYTQNLNSSVVARKEPTASKLSSSPSKTWSMLSEKLDNQLKEVLDRVSDQFELDVPNDMATSSFHSGPTSDARPRRSALKRKYAGLISSSSEHDEVCENEREKKNSLLPRKLFKNMSSELSRSCLTTLDGLYETSFHEEAQISTASSGNLSPKNVITTPVIKSALKKAPPKKKLCQTSPKAKKRKSQRKLELSPYKNVSHKSGTSNGSRSVISFALSPQVLSPPEKGRDCSPVQFELSSGCSPFINYQSFGNSPLIEMSQMSLSPCSDDQRSPVTQPALLDTIKDNLMKPITSQLSEGSSEGMSGQLLDMNLNNPSTESCSSLRDLITKRNMIQKPRIVHEAESYAKSAIKCLNTGLESEKAVRLNAARKYQMVMENVLNCMTREIKNREESFGAAMELWNKQMDKLKHNRLVQEKQLRIMQEAHQEFTEELQQTQTDGNIAQKEAKTALKKEVAAFQRKLIEKHITPDDSNGRGRNPSDNNPKKNRSEQRADKANFTNVPRLTLIKTKREKMPGMNFILSGNEHW